MKTDSTKQNAMTTDVESAEASVCQSWNDANWRRAQETAKRLQKRIAQATHRGDWRMVRKLQRLLTTSHAARLLAVRRVTENSGKRTPGVDGVIWTTPEEKMIAVQTLADPHYRPKPLRRVYIPKRDGKERPLGIPTMLDRAKQSLHALALEPVAETLADENSYGFRPMRSAHDAIEQVFTILAPVHRGRWVLEGDIKSCFDRIDHDWMLKHVPMDRTLLKRWLTAGYVERHAFHPTTSGTVQGGPISPLLANIALDGLERALDSKFVPRRGKHNPHHVNLVRYADDFIVTGDSREFLEQEVMPVVAAFLRERGLELSPVKTRITHVDEGFDFLGFNVRRQSGKLLVKPSKDAIRSLKAKVSAVLHTHQAVTAERLIRNLNPILRGWANYYRHVVSKDIFSSLDWWLFNRLWAWAARRHGGKGKTWISRKYYARMGGITRQFYAGEEAPNLFLYRMNATSIRRHVKVRKDLNPYDSKKANYLEQRQRRIEMIAASERIPLLLAEQGGRCVVCHQSMARSAGRVVLYVPRGSGGDDSTLENFVLQHPDCNRNIVSRESQSVLPDA